MTMSLRRSRKPSRNRSARNSTRRSSVGPRRHQCRHRSPETASARLRDGPGDRSPRDICLSVIVAHELFYGAYRAVRTERAIEQFERLRFPILDLTSADAKRAAEIRAALAASGTPIGPCEVLIAGQALQRGLVVVTRNTREFSRVPDLPVENCEDEAG
ncbi:PIN domain-containing protein [Methylobacterium sp. Leaf466]|uniref:PIN domain-containing protein n=1 Tax=Methylobacterium sp. Leaf466 TaxID=1736386 RepID=UPI000A9C5C83|nr:PIN domain-containing protein [Methylobacterium sp. Leaf466]